MHHNHARIRAHIQARKGWARLAGGAAATAVIVATNHKDEKLTGQYRAYQYPPIASIAAFSRGLQSKSEN
jgi:hypothetical protein